jgi:hypothetical protein
LNVVLRDSEQIAALHNRGAVQPRRPSRRSAGINEKLRGFGGMFDVAGDHRHHRVGKALVVVVILDHHRWPLLAASSLDVGDLNNDDVGTLHW